MNVLDASAAAEIARQTELGKACEAFMLENEKTISCDLVRAELGSVFRKLKRTADLSPEQAESYYNNALALIDEYCPIADLQAEAFRESIRLDHSIYDMYYFVLARRTGATLFTLNKKLAELCLYNGVDCIVHIDGIHD